MTDTETFRERLGLNTAAFDAVLHSIRPGNTENDVKEQICRTWNEKAGRNVPFSGDIVSGERSGSIEGDAAGRILLPGDVLILDLQPGFDSCFADTTRTFFVGSVSEEVRETYGAVIYTLTELEKTLKPGIAAKDIYFRMQELLSEKGYFCPHHAGHAVGLEKLMEPEFLPDRDEKLTAGMIVTLEPGVYFEGNFGIRVENNYIITENGCENLFPYPEDMDYLTIK